MTLEIASRISEMVGGLRFTVRDSEVGWASDWTAARGRLNCSSECPSVESFFFIGNQCTWSIFNCFADGGFSGTSSTDDLE